MVETKVKCGDRSQLAAHVKGPLITNKLFPIVSYS